MLKGADGNPAPGQIRTFVAGAANPVNLETGPRGDLFYVDFDGGTIRRIEYNNHNPEAVATASPTSGAAPLSVSFDGSKSSDPDPGDTLTYAWDLDDDDVFDDSTAANPTYTYTTDGSYSPSLKVTDNSGASDIASVPISVGNSAPTASINAPPAGTTWKVGDRIDFSGSATDGDSTLPASAMSWRLILQHCPSNCHSHVLQTFAGEAGGSFTAPDHEYPSYLELELTATDSGGLKDIKTVRLNPRTVTLTFQTTPGGLNLVVNRTQSTSAFTRTVIVGSKNTISAESPQRKGGKAYNFVSWSDGGAQTHDITAPSTARTYTARFKS
jgi:PKD repeat protein